MSEPSPPRPAPIPPPDRHQIERLNTLYDLSVPAASDGWRGRLADRLRTFLARILFRQQQFNAALVDHINRNAAIGIEAHHASVQTIEWTRQTIEWTRQTIERVEDTLREAHTALHTSLETATARLEAAVDDLRRHQQASAARERRSDAAVASLVASHEELRTSIGVLQQAAQSLKREVARLAESGVPSAREPTAVAAGAAAPSVSPSPQLDSHVYVGFEDQFRGSREDIRRRVAEYLPWFQGASDVLDVGCGRGEFLAQLREHGINARGIDVNAAMVDVCRQDGLEATEADALTYLRAQPDGSLGGLFAAQVVEHLEPRYLAALLDTAFHKLRPAAPIVLETINPGCWFAFFESYLRDLTHERAIHPDTLEYLLVAAGFQRVEIRYRAPYPEHDKLQPIPPHAALGDSVETLNANMERLNRLLFTWLDYAAIGRRP
ncbi:MAG: methyltransferase domain-containing protein [Acidobacteria bacterium]|nr:methyltransferase domain-containing protein [Acidobacteriota bacterium]